MNNNKIIPFQPDGDFHFKQGMKKIEQNKKTEALLSFEKAYELEQENLSFMAQYAYLLAEKGQVTRAEQIIIEQFIQHQYDAEFYFIFSQLYMIIGDANKSFLFGMKYASEFPEEKYEEELEEMFEIDTDGTDDISEEADIFVTSHLFQFLFMNARIEDALDLLNAAPLYIQETKEFRNLKAMALLFLNRYEEAHVLLERLLKEDKTDMHALSHMTLLYYHTDEKAQYEMSLSKLEVVQPMNDDDKFKIGLVLNFLKKYERSFELLYPLYKKNLFMSFQLLHALSQAAYHLDRVNESKEIWEKMQEFHPVSEMHSPWKRAEAEQSITEVEEKYFNDDDLFMRLIGIYRMSRVKPFEAIFGHPVWEAIENLGDLEKMYVSWLYKDVHFKRPEIMHHGMNVLYEHDYEADTYLYEWLLVVNVLYEAQVKPIDIEPYVAVCVYQVDTMASKKYVQELFGVSRYKFQKALDTLSKINEES